jgi:diguanylate cyclase (GGDEF)-like protein
MRTCMLSTELETYQTDRQSELATTRSRKAALAGFSSQESPEDLGSATKLAGKLLAFAIPAVVVLHVVLLLVLHTDKVAASRYCNAAIAMLATLSGVWRANRIQPRERAMWLWASAGLFLWAVAHTYETVLGQSIAASNLKVDPSDFIYIVAAFPMLLALSTTRETASMRAVFYLNTAQIVMASVLTFVLLFRTSMPPDVAGTAMARIYGVTCVLLALMAGLRLFTWLGIEERRCIRCICIFLWTYMPIELGMDFATQRWNLQAGRMFDMLWSVPFVLVSWQALSLPTDEPAVEVPSGRSRGRLLVETACPILITASIFVLAASVVWQHVILAMLAVLLLLLVQVLHACVVQMSYLTAQSKLLEREQELRAANSTLEKLSLLDPLTSIPNRRRFDAAFDEAARRAMRRRKPVSLLVIDVDFFKGINDIYGHAYGDECLITVARVLARQAGRPDDLLARYGGDEFVLLLPETDLNGASAVAKRIHLAIKALAVVNEASPFDGHVTLSVGIGVANAQPGMDMSALMDVADHALYEAKHQGRNTTCNQRL